MSSIFDFRYKKAHAVKRLKNTECLAMVFSHTNPDLHKNDSTRVWLAETVLLDRLVYVLNQVKLVP